MGKVTRQSVHKPQVLRRKESRSGANQSPFAYQPSSRLTTRPHRLTLCHQGITPNKNTILHTSPPSLRKEWTAPHGWMSPIWTGVQTDDGIHNSTLSNPLDSLPIHPFVLAGYVIFSLTRCVIFFPFTLTGSVVNFRIQIGSNAYVIALLGLCSEIVDRI